MNKKYVSFALLATAGVGAIIPAFAENNPSTNQLHRQDNRDRGMMERQDERGEMRGRGMMTRPTAEGTVTAISGNTITISGHQGMASTSSPQTTFTIDATSARVMRNNATSSVSAIAVGDTIGVSGTLTGTTIVATMIRDGVLLGRGDMGNRQGNRGGMMNPSNQANTQATEQLQGNGQPVIAGSITAINGTSITVTNKSNVTYTAEISAAKVIVGGSAAAAASLKVGDMVVIQGAINGSAVTASSVIDNGATQATQTNTQPSQNMGRGFFGGLGGFFGKLFGF